jgi:hypothetical protein
MVIAAEYVSVPSFPARGSILAIADVRDGLPWGDGIGLLDSYNCIGVDVDAVNCSGFKGLTKRFDGPSYSNAHQFSIQCGVTCKGPGFNLDNPALRSAFDALEPEGVSTGLHDTILTTGTDLHSAGAVTPAQALGLLEGAGMAGYAGRPVIHAGPMLASIWAAERAVVQKGDHLETLLGTPVAVSVGNETKTGGVLDAIQLAFVTGHVVLWRSEVVQADAVNQSTNDMTVLYERLYTAAVDCLVAKVQVQW